MSHYNIDSCFFDEYNLHKRMEDVGVNEEKWEYDTDSDRIAAAVKSAEKTIYRFRLLAELERELFSKEEEEGYTISEYNRENYYCQLEILDRLRTMQEIQSIWDTEDDGSFTDEWFGNRSEEYRNALYSRPTDELAGLMPKIDFRGKKLAYHSGLSDIGLILRDDSDLDGIYYNNISYRSIDNLTTYKMSVPFEPHSIWNALLLLMSAHWMWKPKMYILCPIREDGVRLVPRVTMYGDKALATFCSMDLRSYV